ncbi:hypothetical protein [Arthrobacter sp. KNU40]|uniref:hypothetical protein n=1 Tax=Arthrobacter sp. KNU40 TaxID=3447965 RepID=UPI003F63A1D9
MGLAYDGNPTGGPGPVVAGGVVQAQLPGSRADAADFPQQTAVLMFNPSSWAAAVMLPFRSRTA